MALKTEIVEVFPTRNDEWTWHRKARNGRVVRTPGETFSSQSNAMRSAKQNNPGLADADFRVKA